MEQCPPRLLSRSVADLEDLQIGGLFHFRSMVLGFEQTCGFEKLNVAFAKIRSFCQLRT